MVKGQPTNWFANERKVPGLMRANDPKILLFYPPFLLCVQVQTLCLGQLNTWGQWCTALSIFHPFLLAPGCSFIEEQSLDRVTGTSDRELCTAIFSSITNLGRCWLFLYQFWKYFCIQSHHHCLPVDLNQHENSKLHISLQISSYRKAAESWAARRLQDITYTLHGGGKKNSCLCFKFTPA